MLVRVDFMDLRDTLSVLSGAIRNFPTVHVGLRYGDHYLTAPRNEPSSWRAAPAAERVISRFDRLSFWIDPPYHDPKLVSLVGDGHLVSSVPWMIATEFMYKGNDIGVFPYRPSRVSCSGVMSTVLRAMRIDVDADTPPMLFNQLKTLSNQKDSGVTSNDVVQVAGIANS